jgi:tRNA G10  N-methylase Trm11
VKELDIFDKPDLGKFDAIASDLPFGMSILKGEDLEKLYETFIQYCEDVLNTTGRLVVYTSEYEIIEPILLKSKFKIIQSLQLKFITNVDAYLRPKIIVCEFK